MRDELLEWMNAYPKVPGYRDGTFTGAGAVRIVVEDVPRAIRSAVGDAITGMSLQGSAGKGDWTHTPWVAILDPAETSTVEEGVYIVYLLSLGCERLYLTINQGCTTLKDQAGIPAARQELNHRAALMRARVKSARLRDQKIDLNADVWRADLYEHGQVLSKTYSASAMPAEEELRADLLEALKLYRTLLNEGAADADDEILTVAADEIGTVTLTQAKTYHVHRKIERNPSHSKEVKKRQGLVCKGCDRNPAETYGEIARGLVDAHHLRPLASLVEGETVTFDPIKDFAVLCPTCHRVIHRLADVGDVEALRKLITRVPG